MDGRFRRRASWRPVGYGGYDELVKQVPSKAYAEVAAEMLDRVRDGCYAVGGRLPSERHLAEELGVSRPTVREALAALELMTVIETHAGAGSFVRKQPEPRGNAWISDASPSETLEARLALEPRLARIAALSWDRGSLARIARPVRALEKTAVLGSHVHPSELDRQFHGAIAVATGNAVLVQISAPLWELMTETLWRAVKARSWKAANAAVMARDHRAIYDAIRARDADLAAFEMESHLRRVRSELFEDAS